MNKNLKALLACVGILFFIGLCALTLKGPDKTGEETVLGHGGPLEMIPVLAIGSEASPVTVATTTFSNASSSIITAGGLPNLAFVIGYTPASYGSRLALLLERSFDGTNFYPYATITPESGDVLINSSGTTTGGVTFTSPPFLIPGNALGTAVSGTRITTSFDLTLAAGWIRLSAREVSTSTRGTTNIGVYLTSN